MKGGILQVILANARGIGHNIGKRNYYVIVECGSQVYRSKTSRGKPKEICWNEKFTFELPETDLEKHYYLKLKLMHEEVFTDVFVGQTIIYLKGIIVEGNDSGFLEMKPEAYNLVLEDDRYKGHLNVGFQFTPKSIMETKVTEVVQDENGIKQIVYRKLISFFQLQWWRYYTAR